MVTACIADAGHTSPVRRWRRRRTAAGWLASGNRDETVRTWDPGSGQARALTRIDNIVDTFTRLGANEFAIGGLTGLYLIVFLTDASLASIVS